MAAVIGFFTDYQHNKWLDQLLSGVSYTPPATLYLGLLTTSASRLTSKEVVATETLTGFTDFSVDASVNTRITSSSHPFVSADQSVVITGGAGWTTGTYTIGSLTGPAANLAQSPAAVATAAGLGRIVRSTGYARVPLAPGVFNAAVGGQTKTNAAIMIPAPTGTWGTVKAIGIYDALTLGNLLAAISLTAPFTASAGDVAKQIVAGGLMVSRT